MAAVGASGAYRPSDVGSISGRGPTASASNSCTISCSGPRRSHDPLDDASTDSARLEPVFDQLTDLLHDAGAGACDDGGGGGG